MAERCLLRRKKLFKRELEKTGCKLHFPVTTCTAEFTLWAFPAAVWDTLCLCEDACCVRGRKGNCHQTADYCSSAEAQSSAVLPVSCVPRPGEGANNQRGLTAAAAMAAVCAAMAVPFLAFWKPSVPQDVRAKGRLSKLTTWMWVLQKESGKRKKQGRTELYSGTAHHTTPIFLLQTCLPLHSLLRYPPYTNQLQKPPSSDPLGHP